MGFVAVKCPNCGATIELSEDREFGFCTYCGTKVVQDRIVVEHRGNVSISGIASESAVLDRAFLFIEDEKYSEGNSYLEKVLDINPRCSKAYFGKLLCELQFPSISALNSAEKINLQEYDYFKKALRFATKSERAEYEQVQKTIENNTITNYSKELNRRKKAVDDTIQQINEKEAFVDSKRKQQVLNHTKRLLFTILLICDIAFILFLLVGLTAFIEDSELFGIILLILPIIGSIFLLVLLARKLSEIKKMTNEYSNASNELSHLRTDLKSLQQQYDSWQLQKPDMIE